MSPTHLVNRLLAALLALALVAGGLLAAVEIALARFGLPYWFIPREQWGGWLGGQSWDATLVRLVLVGIALVGLLLLFVALRRGRIRQLPVESSHPGVRFTVSRHGAQRALAAAARRTSGVRTASAKVGRRTAKVTARTDLRSNTQVLEEAQTAVTTRLADLGLDRLRPRVKVKGSKR